MTSRDNTKMAHLASLQGGVSGIGQRRTRLTRNWTYARSKVEGTGCVIEGCTGPPQAAHIIGRRHDGSPPLNVKADDWDSRKLLVWPDRVVGLCGPHHRAFDNGDLDLLPYLTVSEQAQAVADADGVFPMLWRTMASENPKRAA